MVQFTTCAMRVSALAAAPAPPDNRASTPRGPAMTRTHWAVFVVALSLATAACEPAPVPSLAPTAPVATPADPTATIDPLETIEARRLLMAEVGRQMTPIDLYTIGTPANPEALRASATAIESLLPSLPHLFPQGTNLFDASAHEPPTTALPAVWENFAGFQAMTANAEHAAAALVTADGEDQIKAAAQNLRAACDACHQAFMKAYVPPQVTDEDRNLDFDEFLPK
jgi:cytochrome c556